MYHNFSDKRQNKYTLDFKTFNNQLDKLLVDGFVIEGFDGLWVDIQFCRCEMQFRNNM